MFVCGHTRHSGCMVYYIAGDKTSVYLIICMNGLGVEIKECLTIWEVRQNNMGHSIAVQLKKKVYPLGNKRNLVWRFYIRRYLPLSTFSLPHCMASEL